MAPFKLSKRTNTIQETKWFIVSVLTSLMTFLILSTYIFTTIRYGELVFIGTIYIYYIICPKDK